MLPKTSRFLETIVRFLMPFFLGTTVDIDAARAEILETLESYGTRTRSEMLNAAQIIAFGMSALATLAEAQAPDLSPSLRLRFRGCANGLNRSGQQNERTLDRRLACDVPEMIALMAEPIDDISDEDSRDILIQVRAQIDSYRNRLSGARPATHSAADVHTMPASKDQRNNRLSDEATMKAMGQMGMPVEPGATATQSAIV